MILDVDFEWSIEQLNGLSDEEAERLEGLLWEVLDGVVCRQILPAAFERTDRLFGLKQMFWLELLDEQNGGNGPSAAIVRSAQSEGELELKNTMTIFECSDLDQWRAMRHGSLRSKALQDVDLMLGLLAALFKDPNSV